MDAIAAASGRGRAVAGRRDSELATESAGKVALVNEAGLDRSLGRAPARCEHPPGQADPLLQKVGMWGRSYRAREAA